MTNKFYEFDDLYIKINTGYMPSLLDFRRDRNQSAPAPKEMCGTYIFIQNILQLLGFKKM